MTLGDDELARGGRFSLVAVTATGLQPDLVENDVQEEPLRRAPHPKRGVLEVQHWLCLGQRLHSPSGIPEYVRALLHRLNLLGSQNIQIL